MDYGILTLGQVPDQVSSQRQKMRHRSVFSYLGILTLTTRLIVAWLFIPQVQEPYTNQPSEAEKEEDGLNNSIELGFGWKDPQMVGKHPNGPPLLSDILSIDKSISIFAGLSRSLEPIVRISLCRPPNERRLFDWQTNLLTRLFLFP